MSIQLFDFDKNNLNNPAIVYQDKVITYAQLLEKSAFIANIIKQLDIKQRIGICMGNEPLFIASLLAIHNRQHSIVLLNSEATAAELEQHITQLNLQYLLLSDTTTPLFEQTAYPYSTVHQLTDSDCGNLIVCKIHNKVSEHAINSIATPSTDQEFIVSFTSGISGVSRIVSRSYKNFQSELNGLFDAFNYTQDDRFICPAPVFHAYALVNAVFAALRANACLYLIPHFIPNQVLNTIATEKATVFIGVPLMYELLNQALIDKTPNLDTLRICLSAGAKLNLETAETFKNKFSISINQLYGSSETGAVAANLLKDGFQDLQSVGQTFNGTEIVIVNPEGKQLAANQEGEIKIKSDAITAGYLGETELNTQMFKDRWFFPGDMGKFDQQGNLYITGRKSLFINVAGKKVDPFEIEQVLLQIDELKECVVIGLPDEQVEELVAAIIVVTQPISESSILQFCATKLSYYKVPKRVYLLDSLPRSAVGKILKNQLKEQFSLHSTKHKNIAGIVEQSLIQQGLPKGQYQSAQPSASTARQSTQTQLGVAVIQKIASLIQNLLYLEAAVEAESTFVALGIDSIMMTQLAHELTVFYAIELSPSAFYSYPTPQKLAVFLVNDSLSQVASKHDMKVLSSSSKLSSTVLKQHQQGIVFNQEASPTLFFFPAFFGLALGYQKLAAICTQVRFYCFDFIESDQRMAIYYQQIKQQQPTGPYVLFGYSAGGNLAFEAARYLESKGEVVSDIIFADSYIEPEMQPFDFKEFMLKSRKKHYLPEQIKYLVANKIAYKKTEKRTAAFHYFLSHMKMEPIIQANIHNLLAVDDGTRESVSFDWTPYTEGKYKAYRAKGFHADLLIPPYLPITASILNDILEQIGIGSQQ